MTTPLLRLLAVCWLAAALAACASLPPPEGAARPEEPPAARSGPGTQSLFRLVYDSGEGRVSTRVVLRRLGPDDFQLLASDVAGRPAWGLDLRGERSVLVDHRQRLYCVGGEELRLDALHPSELPLTALPRILDGALPFPPPDDLATRDGEVEWIDEADRQWSAAFEGGALRRWTLLRAGEPTLWWTASEGDAILSRRGGEQYRWSRVAREEVSLRLDSPVPDGFEEGVCGD